MADPFHIPTIPSISTSHHNGFPYLRAPNPHWGKPNPLNVPY